MNNDSLSFSQADEDNLLLSDDVNVSHQICSYSKQPQTEDHFTQSSITKISAIRESSDITTMFSVHGCKYEEKGNTVKSFKKLVKDKQQFLKYDDKIQNISLSEQSHPHKIHELVSLIESQRLLANQKRLKSYISEIIKITEDLACQKRNLQRELESVIQINKVMAARLKQVYDYFLETKSQWSKIGSCPRSFQSSKNKQSSSPINLFEAFQFGQTMINNVEELQLKKMEDQENITKNQMPLIELLWIFKNKAEGSIITTSEQFINKKFSNATLKSWIKIIDAKISNIPKISDFDADLDFSNIEEPCMMEQFIEVLQQHQDHYIQNINKSLLPARQSEFLRYSTLMTFIQILSLGKDKIKKEEAMKYFGKVNRQLCLIQKKTNTEISVQNEGRRSKVEELIDGLF